jgi:osmoprotectant transport system substrate-binding protein
MRSRRRTLVAALALAVLPSCVTPGPGEEVARSRGRIPDRSDGIVIGAFNFSESRVLAEIFKQALNAEGLEAEVIERVASREIMEPALEQGEVDLVPEYMGTALTFIDPNRAVTVNSENETFAALTTAFERRGIAVLEPAPGQNRNEIAVTRATAARYSLLNISDLVPFAPELTFGGPPECPARPLCLAGLEDVYGLEFGAFRPLDPGGLITVAALDGGEVDVALLFTTNPEIANRNLVTLTDDLELQPYENIVPVLRQEVIERYGGVLVRALNAATERLTDATLRELNRRVEILHVPVEAVATAWLESEGL